MGGGGGGREAAYLLQYTIESIKETPAHVLGERSLRTKVLIVFAIRG